MQKIIVRIILIAENIKIILTIRKGHGILTKLFRTTEMIEADSDKEK